MNKHTKFGSREHWGKAEGLVIYLVFLKRLTEERKQAEPEPTTFAVLVRCRTNYATREALQVFT